MYQLFFASETSRVHTGLLFASIPRMNLIEIIMTGSSGSFTQAPKELLSKANGYAEVGTGRGIYFVATDQPVTNWVNTMRSLGLQGSAFHVDVTTMDLTNAPPEFRSFILQHFPHAKIAAA